MPEANAVSSVSFPRFGYSCRVLTSLPRYADQSSPRSSRSVVQTVQPFLGQLPDLRRLWPVGCDRSVLALVAPDLPGGSAHVGVVMAGQEIGRRVKYWRERRGFTRGHFGDLVGRSPSWVDKIESGERQLDRISVLEMIATALDVPVHVLLDDAMFKRGAECIDPSEIVAIRNALQHYDLFASAPVVDHARSVGEISRQVDYAWLAFQASDYAALGPILAVLIRHAQSANVESGGSTETRLLLSQSYQIVASTVRKLEYYDLEWIATERALALVNSSDDPVIYGGAAFRLVNALRDNDGPESAMIFARQAADSMQPVGSQSPERQSVYGHILLQGAMAAAQASEAAEAREMLSAAGRVARELGGDRNDYFTAFGPTNVMLHEIAAFVELREWHQAVQLASSVQSELLNGLPRERRASYLLDVARAYSLGGKREESAWALLEADQLAPKEIRCRPQAKDLIAELVRRSKPRPSSNLLQLAQRVGVPS